MESCYTVRQVENLHWEIRLTGWISRKSDNIRNELCDAHYRYRCLWGRWGGLLKGGSVVPNYVCEGIKGRTVKVWIQKIKNSNLMTYVESLFSYIIEQEFTNMFQNTYSRIQGYSK